jgi:hypothetical protein
MGIVLLHGWVAELDSEKEAFGSLSYNQAVDLILTTPEDPQAKIISEFFHRTSSQLTETGIQAIKSCLKNGQLAVFFRNNHFSTIIKQGNEIYVLVTDVGFNELDEVVWECLSEVDGNNHFCNSEFAVLDIYKSQQVSNKNSANSWSPVKVNVGDKNGEQKKEEIHRHESNDSYKEKEKSQDLTRNNEDELKKSEGKNKGKSENIGKVANEPKEVISNDMEKGQENKKKKKSSSKKCYCLVF